MKAPMRMQFAILCAVPFLMVLGNSTLFPIFPKIQSALSLSGMQTSLIVTAFSVPAGLLIPLAGYLSDTHGRRWVMVPAVVLFGIGALVAGLSISIFGRLYFGLMLGRVIQGVGAAGLSQTATALAADIFTSGERSKVLGMLESANGIGKVISPIAGGLMGLVAFWLPFYLFAALAVALAILLRLRVKEPDVKRATGGFGQYLSMIGKTFHSKGRSLGAMLLAGAIGLFILFGTLFFLSEVLEKRYGMPELLVGFIMALPVAMMSLTSYGVGLYLSKRRQMAKTAIWSGLIVVTAVMVVVALVSHRWALLVAISFMGVGGGLVLPSLALLFASSTTSTERGGITSLYGGVRFIGVALGPPAFGYLMRFGQPIVFGVAAALVAVSALAALIWIHPGQLMSGGGGDSPEEQEPKTSKRHRFQPQPKNPSGPTVR